MHKSYIFVLFIISFFLASCVDFIQPSQNEPFAQLNINSARKSLTTSNTYASFDGNPCEDKNTRMRNLTAGFSWLSEGKMSLRVPVNRPIYIQGNINNFGGGTPAIAGNIAIKMNTCISVASFTPEPSHNYQLTQLATNKSCELTVIDSATYTTPESFKFHNANMCSR